MTRIAWAQGYGGPENLAVADIERPTPGEGQILIDVVAAAVNPIDWKLYSGMMGTDPSRLPIKLGFEVSGRIAEIGRGDARGFAIGNEVIASVTAGYAESVVADAANVYAKPDELPWDEASGVLLTGGTAVHLLEAAGVKEGDVVLVHGGSGGVGQIVIQLAIARGARVIATSSDASTDIVESLGATRVSYAGDIVSAVREVATEGIDVALDLIGTDEAVTASAALVADTSRIATIADSGRARELGFKVLGGGPGADPGTEIRAAARQGLVDAAGRGELKITVARTFPLAEAAEAHRLSMTGHARGKIVLRP